MAHLKVNDLENCETTYKLDVLDVFLWIVFGGITCAIWYFAGLTIVLAVIMIYLVAAFVTGLNIWTRDLNKEDRKKFLAAPFWDVYILIFYGWFIWISIYELSKDEIKRGKPYYEKK